MPSAQEQITALIAENESLKCQIEQLQIERLHSQLSAEKDNQDWCMINGSTWEPVNAAPSTDSMSPNELVGSAFRQIKYELYCASVDLLGYSLIITPNRNCIARSIYFLDDTSKQFEFIYDHDKHCYTDIVWSEFVQDYESVFRYWLMERQSIPGFLSEVFMDMYNQLGQPPVRTRVHIPDPQSTD